jgi:hypothetical protein
MNTALIILLAIAAVGVLYVLLPIGMDEYFRLRGPRVVMCPDSQAPEEVEFDAGFGALTALSGWSTLRVKHCARWQDARSLNCAQGCLQGIDALAGREHGLLTRPLQMTRPSAQQT